MIEVDEFDPYYQWLAIPKDTRPPNHYQLLGLQMFEANALVIENAADSRMRHLSSYAIGRHAAISQRLMTEISAARVCLCDATKKAAYDDGLCIEPEAVSVQPLKSVADLPDPEEVNNDPEEDADPHAFPQVTPLPRQVAFGNSEGPEKHISIQTSVDSRYKAKNPISPLLLAGLILCFVVALLAIFGMMLS